MPKLSNKKTLEIKNTSVAVEVIKGQECNREDDHWTNTPPEVWTLEEKEKWDLVFDVEQKLKEKIINLFN